MKVKISEKLLCIPPYVSTTWDQVTFLQSEKEGDSGRLALLLHLAEGQVICIPHLEPSLIEIIFSAHSQFLERHVTKKEEALQKNAAPSLFGITPDQMAAFQLRLNTNMPAMEGIENAFQHNPAQAHAPSLPQEMIEKIAAIAKIVTGGDLSSFPKPEPHCNCIHCQVSRSVHQLTSQDPLSEEETVSDNDLKFRNWEITQNTDTLYTVTSPLDSREQYSVFLGTPVGCTCGQAHCEHIKAVLLSD